MAAVYDRLGRQIHPGALMIRVVTGGLVLVVGQQDYADEVHIFQMPVENPGFSLIGGQCFPLVASPWECVRGVEVIRYVLPPWSRSSAGQLWG